MDQLKSVSVTQPANNIVDTAIARGAFNTLPKGSKRFAAALVVAGLAIIANPSHANDLQIEAVSYRDLNLTWSEGASVLYGRIKAAAGRVCNSDGGRDLRAVDETKMCVDKAIADAVAQVNHPMLTDYYFARFGKIAPVPKIAAESR